MNIFSKKNALRLIAIGMLMVVAIGLFPMRRANATGIPVFDASTFGQSLLSAINTTFISSNEYAMNLKEYTLDGVAWGIAKMVLQQMTTDVVNWINSGFQGSPAFLTDPETFFLDQADQITGAFISDQGPLQALCSPFAIDIRLSIAKTQAYRSPRYTCTLSTIINNAKNTTLNGRSISGFMKGDFSQGGWSSFIALTTEPQNNATGAFLTAQSDVQQQLAEQQGATNADLNRGGGFMSWKKCTDVSPQALAIYTKGQAPPGTHYTITHVGNKGDIKFQDCHVETPGSVISGTLQKQLGIPADQLNIADEFNEIIGALFSQLVGQVLTGGLHAASQPSSGQNQSFINRLGQESVAQATSSAQQLKSSLDSYIEPATDYSYAYSAAYSTLLDGQNKYKAAQSACVSINNSSAAAAIQQKLDAEVNPTVASAKASADIANAKYGALMDAQESLNNAKTPADLQKANKAIGDLLNNKTSTSAVVTARDVINASNAADAAGTTAAAWLADAATYQTLCSNPTTATSTTP